MSLSLDETVTRQDLDDLKWVFGVTDQVPQTGEQGIFASPLQRKGDYLQHPVFSSHQSETQLLRYMKMLENKDISLVHSMIPLVSTHPHPSHPRQY